ncbi:hypothetical protein A2U01_0081190 [Trifolium medium]|uniref:Uncharacterized protein n=1 Tax=Trifolium medium TaxID=97028 RepID=A0A392TJ37_9FABA|nr:hypothetical protein [Trifolium medium]
MLGGDEFGRTKEASGGAKNGCEFCGGSGLDRTFRD